MMHMHMHMHMYMHIIGTALHDTDVCIGSELYILPEVYIRLAYRQ